MQFETDPEDRAAEIIALIRDTFTASEGAAEGALIGSLVSALLHEIRAEDRITCTASVSGHLAGAIIFTLLRYPDDPRSACLLSPVAVHPDQQRRGIGQALLHYGIGELRARGTDVVMTYGDPAFYGKLGFLPVDAHTASPPQPLSMPQGWLAQALDGGAFAPIKGTSICVAPFNRPELW